MNQVNYATIFIEAVKKTWKHKILWLFAVMTGSGSSWVNIPSFGEGEEVSEEKIEWAMDDIMSVLNDTAIVTAIVIVSAVIIIGFVAISAFGRGALVGSLKKIHNNEKINWKEGAKEGRKYFWKILGMKVVFFLFFLGLAITILVPVLFLVETRAIVASIFVGIIAVLIFLPVAFLSRFVNMLAVIYIVFGNLSLFESISNGYALMRKRIGPVIITWLVVAGISFAITIALVPIVLVLGVMFFGVGAAGFAIFGENAIITTVIIAIGIFLLILIPLGAILQTFNHSVWVEFFLQVAKTDEDVPEPGKNDQKTVAIAQEQSEGGVV